MSSLQPLLSANPGERAGPSDPHGSGHHPNVGPLLPVVGGDLQIPLVTGTTTRYVNLDYAASAPALQVVAERLTEILPYYASVHRGAGFTSQVSTRLYEQARHAVARFVGAREHDLTIFTRNTTDALNLLADCVPDGGEVVVLDVEHHANFLPWRAGRRGVVPVQPTWAETLVTLREAVASRRPALLAITGSSNVTGEVLPLRELADLAHRYGARIVVDAAQLAPHRPIAMGELDIDYLALSGHKLYAPFGAGALVGRRDWLDTARPYLAGGGAVEHVGLHDVRWATGAQRHEAGTPNVLGAVALARACEELSALPPVALRAHEERLTDHLREGLAQLDGVVCATLWGDVADRIAVVTFTVEGFAPDALAAVLGAEYGIGLRDGRFCAHPLLERLGLPGGALRASLGAGSCSHDVQRLLEALGAVIREGLSWSYERVRGRPSPVPDPRDPGPIGPAPELLAGTPACQASDG